MSAEGLEDPMKLFPGIPGKSESPLQYQESPQGSDSGSEDRSTPADQSEDSSKTSSHSDEDTPTHEQFLVPGHTPSVPSTTPATAEIVTNTAQPSPPDGEVPLLLPADGSPVSHSLSQQEEAKDSKEKIARKHEEPGLSEILEEQPTLGGAGRHTLEANGDRPHESKIESLEEEEVPTKEPEIECETVQDEVGIHKSASPPEYQYDIPKAKFSQVGWVKTETYSKGKLDVETKVSLLTNITQPTQLRTSSAVVQLTVSDRKPEHEYNARATVTLYDEAAGHILKESTEEREIEKGRDTVKFTVDMGLQKDIEETKSKKLQLQVKVRVDEKHTFKAYWEKLKVSKCIHFPVC